MSCADTYMQMVSVYLKDALEAEKNRKLGEGLFGFGKKPGDEPFHGRFLEDAAKILSSDIPPEERVALLAEVFRVPSPDAPKAAYWGLLAVHGAALPLIPGLEVEEARKLAASYAADYPRWKRLPAQDKVLKALEKAAKG